jgi:hypothetical protein
MSLSMLRIGAKWVVRDAKNRALRVVQVLSLGAPQRFEPIKKFRLAL